MRHSCACRRVADAAHTGMQATGVLMVVRFLQCGRLTQLGPSNTSETNDMPGVWRPSRHKVQVCGCFCGNHDRHDT